MCKQMGARLSGRFRVTITETLKRTVEVEAEDQHKAVQTISDGWHSGSYILDADDFVGVEFEALPFVNEPM